MRTEDRPGPSRTGVIVIENKKNKIVGKIIIAYPKDGAGRLHVSMWDWTGKALKGVQTASATGYGYDKMASAMSGMVFGPEEKQFTFTDHPKPWDMLLHNHGYTTFRLI